MTFHSNHLSIGKMNKNMMQKSRTKMQRPSILCSKSIGAKNTNQPLQQLTQKPKFLMPPGVHRVRQSMTSVGIK